MGEICTESAGCFPTFAEAMAAQPGGGRLEVGTGDYFESIVLRESYQITALVLDVRDPVILHSPGGGAPILDVSGPGVDASVTLLDFDAVDGRVFEVEDGAELTVSSGIITSNASRTLGAIGLAEGATLTLAQLDISGGVGQRGGQLYAEDSDVNLYATRFTGGRAHIGGVIELVDTDGLPETYDVQVLEVDAPDVPRTAGALRIEGGDVDCISCLFRGGTSGLRVEDANAFVLTSRFEDLENEGVRALGDGSLSIVNSDFTNILGVAVTVNSVPDVRVTGTSFAHAGGALQLDRIGGGHVVGNRFCDVGAPDVANPIDVATDVGTVRIANNRFLGAGGTATIHTSGYAAGTVQIDVVHNDFVGNTSNFVLRGTYTGPGQSQRDHFVDNLVVGQRDALSLIASAALAEAHHNLGSDNADAPWATGMGADEMGFDGFPGWSSFVTTGDACDLNWHVQPVPGTWPSWRYDGRDAGAWGTDPDGTPSDIGAVGGDDADEAYAWFWEDTDEDGWPRIYDCGDDGPEHNPTVVDAPYDNVDSDCDGWSDNDADRDGYDADDEGGTDCNDSDASVNPAEYDEPNDLVDQNCDNDRDADGDGFVWPEDCDDRLANVHPGAAEDPGGLDRDCDTVADVRAPIVPIGCVTSPGSRASGAILALSALLALRRGRRR